MVLGQLNMKKNKEILAKSNKYINKQNKNEKTLRGHICELVRVRFPEGERTEFTFDDYVDLHVIFLHDLFKATSDYQKLFYKWDERYLKTLEDCGMSKDTFFEEALKNAKFQSELEKNKNNGSVKIRHNILGWAFTHLCDFSGLKDSFLQKREEFDFNADCAGRDIRVIVAGAVLNHHGHNSPSEETPDRVIHDFIKTTNVKEDLKAVSGVINSILFDIKGQIPSNAHDTLKNSLKPFVQGMDDIIENNKLSKELTEKLTKVTKEKEFSNTLYCSLYQETQADVTRTCPYGIRNAVFKDIKGAVEQAGANLTSDRVKDTVLFSETIRAVSSLAHTETQFKRVYNTNKGIEGLKTAIDSFYQTHTGPQSQSQNKAVDSTLLAFKEHKHTVLMCGPTGSGKSITSLNAAVSACIALDGVKNITYLVPTQEIANNVYESTCREIKGSNVSVAMLTGSSANLYLGSSLITSATSDSSGNTKKCSPDELLGSLSCVNVLVTTLDQYIASHVKKRRTALKNYIDESVAIFDEFHQIGDNDNWLNILGGIIQYRDDNKRYNILLSATIYADWIRLIGVKKLDQALNKNSKNVVNLHGNQGVMDKEFNFNVTLVPRTKKKEKKDDGVDEDDEDSGSEEGSDEVLKKESLKISKIIEKYDYSIVPGVTKKHVIEYLVKLIKKRKEKSKFRKIAVICERSSYCFELIEELNKEALNNPKLSVLPYSGKLEKSHRERGYSILLNTFGKNKTPDHEVPIVVSTNVIRASLELEFDDIIFIGGYDTDNNTIVQADGRRARFGLTGLDSTFFLFLPAQKNVIEDVLVNCNGKIWSDLLKGCSVYDLLVELSSKALNNKGSELLKANGLSTTKQKLANAYDTVGQKSHNNCPVFIEKYSFELAKGLLCAKLLKVSKGSAIQKTSSPSGAVLNTTPMRDFSVYVKIPETLTDGTALDRDIIVPCNGVKTLNLNADDIFKHSVFDEPYEGATEIYRYQYIEVLIDEVFSPENSFSASTDPKKVLVPVGIRNVSTKKKKGKK